MLHQSVNRRLNLAENAVCAGSTGAPPPAGMVNAREIDVPWRVTFAPSEASCKPGASMPVAKSVPPAPSIVSPAAPGAGSFNPTLPATGATSPAQTAQAAAALDLASLEQRLRDTRAIGVFTKLSLKNQVDDLLAQFKSFHHGQTPPTLTQLRQKFELLLIKVVSVLQDGDAALAAEVSSSREALWSILSDPQKFAQI